MTHNQVVTGSSPVGPTLKIKHLRRNGKNGAGRGTTTSLLERKAAGVTALNNCTPASVYNGTNKIILEQRRLLKQKSMKQRRRNHLRSKSAIFL